MFTYVNYTHIFDELFESQLHTSKPFTPKYLSIYLLSKKYILFYNYGIIIKLRKVNIDIYYYYLLIIYS